MIKQAIAVGEADVSLVNRGFASACKGAYLAHVTAARAKQSTIYRAKPNPPKKDIQCT